MKNHRNETILKNYQSLITRIEAAEQEFKELTDEFESHKDQLEKLAPKLTEKQKEISAMYAQREDIRDILIKSMMEE